MTTEPDKQGQSVGVLDRIRSTAAGRHALKVGIGIFGGLVVAIGIVLIPFPGPGWAIVILGLAIWAIEFAWARNLLTFTKRHVKSWTDWIKRQNWPVRALVGIACMIFVSAIVYFSVKLSFGIDLIQVARDWLAQRGA